MEYFESKFPTLFESMPPTYGGFIYKEVWYYLVYLHWFTKYIPQRLIQIEYAIDGAGSLGRIINSCIWNTWNVREWRKSLTKGMGQESQVELRPEISGYYRGTTMRHSFWEEHHLIFRGYKPEDPAALHMSRGHRQPHWRPILHRQGGYSGCRGKDAGGGVPVAIGVVSLGQEALPGVGASQQCPRTGKKDNTRSCCHPGWRQALKWWELR